MDEQEMIRFLRSELYQAMERDPELRAALKHIDAGKGTFQDTAQYSERTSELLGQILSKHVDELPEGMREAVCKALLRERYEEMNGICAEVQEQLDAQIDIRLQPQRAPYPAERVQQVAHALEDPTVALSVIQRRAKAPVANVSKSFHDDYMQKNADVRSRLGFKCYLNRVAATGCCKWCTDIAGRYVYGDHPDEVFHRHDNCACTVTYENGRERQDVWSKRKWQADPAEVEANGFKPVVNSQEKAAEIEEQQMAQFIGLTSGKKRGKMKEKEPVFESIWEKITAVLSGKVKDSKLDQKEIEEALRTIGFSTVDRSFFTKVDKKMQISITDQLKLLEDRFHAVSRSKNPFIIADLKGDAVASCRCQLDNPDVQYLRLSTSRFKHRSSHLAERRKDIKDFYCMPCLDDDETLSRYVVTHEYGHMLENALVAQDMQGRMYSSSRYYEFYKRDIEKIARDIDPKYDQNKSKYLSEYGHKDDREFFAECFANSQLGQPNVLGLAMTKWLEGRGF